MKPFALPAKRSIPRRILVASFIFFALAVTTYLYVSSAEPALAPFADHRNLQAVGVLVADDWSGGPRECDVLNGILESCIFPD